MKNIFIKMLVVVGICAPALVFAQTAPTASMPPVACTTITRNLVLGSSDQGTSGDVTRLQYFLVNKGYLDISKTVAGYGYFGGWTKGAVEKFQAAYGISPSGTVGPLTRAKITAVSCVPTNPNAPTITITSPTVGETWPKESQKFFQWKINNSNTTTPRVSIDLVGNGTTYRVVTNTAGIDTNMSDRSGDYLWEVGYIGTNDTVPPGQYSVKICTADNYCQTAGPLTITGAPAGAIQVISPAQGDVWVQGAGYTIKWTAFRGDFDDYEVMLSNKLVPETQGGVPVPTAVSKNKTSFKINPADLSDTLIQTWLANGKSGISESDLRQNFYFVVNAVKNLPNGKESIVASGTGGVFSIVSPVSNGPSVDSFTVTAPSIFNPNNIPNTFDVDYSISGATSQSGVVLSVECVAGIGVYTVNDGGQKVPFTCGKIPAGGSNGYFASAVQDTEFAFTNSNSSDTQMYITLSAKGMSPVTKIVTIPSSTNTITGKLSISPTNLLIKSGTVVNLTFSNPSNATRALFNLACPTGVTSAAGTGKSNLCNTWTTFPMIPSGLTFTVTNSTKTNQEVVPNYSIYTTTSPTYSTGVTSDIIVQP